jgi:uracil-DNA glycosylase
MITNLISQTHPEWHNVLQQALLQVEPNYLEQLSHAKDWLPEPPKLFAAFSEPISSTRYILLGESPYPRAESANGYAFWDNAVHNLWCENGLSKEVNRATSLRNLMKMLLIAQGTLQDDYSQAAIAQLDKSVLIKTAGELFNAFLAHGFLLLNASLIYSDGQVNYHAKQWRPFIQTLLEWLAREKPSVELVLWGRIADQVPKTSLTIALQAEHPYNLSFITNDRVIQFFKPLELLIHHE